VTRSGVIVVAGEALVDLVAGTDGELRADPGGVRAGASPSRPAELRAQRPMR